MRPFLIALALIAGVLILPQARADAGLAGYWNGDGKDDEGRRYEIEIVIGRGGQASYEYRSLGSGHACTGTLSLLGREGDAFRYRDELQRGPAACGGYGRVELKPRGDGSSLFYTRFGGGFALRGDLRGFRLTVKPETCAECTAAEAQDIASCRFLAMKEGQSDAATKACLDSAARSEEACRRALKCPALGP